MIRVSRRFFRSEAASVLRSARTTTRGKHTFETEQLMTLALGGDSGTQPSVRKTQQLRTHESQTRWHV